MDLDELERLYRDAPLGPAPSGIYLGQFLHWLDTPGARRPLVRVLDTLMFERTRFGVDFTRRLWWFITPSLAAGRFFPTLGRSRWRDADTYRLDYSPTRILPLRKMLYDEVKPLDADRCIGLGGVNAERGEGDHFWFSLTRT